MHIDIPTTNSILYIYIFSLLTTTEQIVLFYPITRNVSAILIRSICANFMTWKSINFRINISFTISFLSLCIYLFHSNQIELYFIYSVVSYSIECTQCIEDWNIILFFLLNSKQDFTRRVEKKKMKTCAPDNNAQPHYTFKSIFTIFLYSIIKYMMQFKFEIYNSTAFCCCLSIISFLFFMVFVMTW